MVKKVIDIIPPEGWPDNKIQAADGAVFRSFADDPAAVKPRPDEFAPGGDSAAGKVASSVLYTPQNTPQKAATARAAEKPEGGFWPGIVWKLAIAAAVIAGAMWAIDSKFAKAQISIRPQTFEFKQELKVAVDSSIGDIDRVKNAIPGFMIAVEKEIVGDAPVTGKKDSQGRAQGEIKIFNNYTAAQRLVKGTRLQAPLEKFQPALAGDESPWFRTLEDITVPAKSTAAVKVAADGAGEKYNIEASVFSIPGLAGTAQYSFIYGQSYEKFVGGSAQTVPEVTKDDLENAKTEIANQANEAIKNEIIAKAKGEGLEIIGDDALKIELGEPRITAKTGDNIVKIGGMVLAKAAVIAYKKTDLEDLGGDFVAGRLPAGHILDAKSLRFESSYAKSEKSPSEPIIDLIGKAMIYQGMPIDDLKKALSEKKVSEARVFLANQPGTKEADIKLAPPWRSAVPRGLDRIEIEVILD